MFNLDCIADGAIDGLDVLAEIRKIRDDVVLVAFMRSNSGTIPLKRARPADDSASGGKIGVLWAWSVRRVSNRA